MASRDADGARAAAAPFAQLLLYRFGPGTRFEGGLTGALGRLESGGALRILEALFVRSAADGGEIEVESLRGDGAGGIVGPLISFRLDAAERVKATKKALDGPAARISAEVLRELADSLEPGGAVAAVLVDHAWRRALEDAVTRTGGVPVSEEFVDTTTLSELADDVLTAVRAP